MTQDRPVDVFFIMGSGRSGSTLLDRLLGLSPDIISAGELKYLFRNFYDQNRLCGCGEPVAKCAFWQAVADRAYGGASHIRRAWLRSQRWIDAGHMVAMLALLPWQPARLRRELAEVREALARLYPAIAAEAGVSAIVDSSKSPRAAVLATLPGVRLHVIHLVRDARAVAFSWRRGMASGRPMGRRSLLRAASDWWRTNLGTWVMARRWGGHAFLRYEDLVARPQETVAAIAARAGLRPPSLEGEGRYVELPAAHLAGGNPMRLRHGPTAIVEDEEWKQKMPWRDKLLVTLLTWPLLLAYGYPIWLGRPRRRLQGAFETA